MSAFITNPITTVSENINTKQVPCRLYKPFLPSFTPVINTISVTTSVSGQYSLVYINGSNFLPNAVTYVNFGDYSQLSITYYSSFNISFVVPKNAPAGIYDIVVVNLYNGQLSPAVKYSYSGVLNYSKPVSYTLT